jgi:hypothetical protein
MVFLFSFFLFYDNYFYLTTRYRDKRILHYGKQFIYFLTITIEFSIIK